MKTLVLFCLGLIVGYASPVPAVVGIPDLSQSTATSNAGHIYITPDGAGPSLAAANAVITLTLRDGSGMPIPHYPHQDLWVDDDGNNDIFMCFQGSLADHDTDVNGQTTFSGAYRGGGWTQAGLRVYLAGMPIDTGPVSIDVASPDYNRDQRVDIVDLGQFAMDYNDPGYAFWCDFNGDGVEDLADLGIFAAHHGVLGCP